MTIQDKQQQKMRYKNFLTMKLRSKISVKMFSGIDYLIPSLIVTLLLFFLMTIETSLSQELDGQPARSRQTAPWQQQVTGASLRNQETHSSNLLNKRQSSDQLMAGDEEHSNVHRDQPTLNSRSSTSWRQYNHLNSSTIMNHSQLRRSPEISTTDISNLNPTHTPRSTTGDICSDRLCYGLPKGCLDRNYTLGDPRRQYKFGCKVLVTSKHLIDPYKPAARDIHFELVASPEPGQDTYAAVGFSDTGRMSGLVSECIRYEDPTTKLQVITLAHSYNLPNSHSNFPVTILSGIKNLGVSFEEGYYQCRWIVESSVEFTYINHGQTIHLSEDLGYKNYHILLASGGYDRMLNRKDIHDIRVSSEAPISLAQTGLIASLGSHVFVRIHGSLMIFIWIGLVTVSILVARYYKEDLTAWFIIHRAFMLIAWFGSIFSVIFAYMFTESFHPVNSTPGIHQICGCTCLILTTIQVLAGLMRPSLSSSKRVYFNWLHFICGNLGYLCAITSIVTAAFLAPAHLPPIYMWIVASFVIIYAFFHLIMTTHQYIVHKSSKLSITPRGDQCDHSGDSNYSPKSTFKQVMLGVVATIIVIFIVLLISLINMK